MEILRTPDDRFVDLADYPYDPNYLTCGDLRIHYVDQGDSDDEPYLCFMESLPGPTSTAK